MIMCVFCGYRLALKHCVELDVCFFSVIVDRVP